MSGQLPFRFQISTALPGKSHDRDYLRQA